MSCIFLTKLRGSSGRAKWLRLEQRPFNYFAARTFTAYTHTRMHGYRVSHSCAYAYATTVYVRSHLVVGIAKVRPFDASDGERLHVSALFTQAPRFKKASPVNSSLTVQFSFLFKIPIFQHYSIFRARILP